MKYLSRRSFVALCSSSLLRAPISLWGASRATGISKVNIALNRAAYQSNSVNDDHTAHLVTDGSPETYWESKPSQEAWIAVDLGEVCAFDELTLHWGESYATVYRLQLSSDATYPGHWQDVSTLQKGNAGVQTIQPGPTMARHVRLLVTAFSKPDRGCILKEIRIAGQRATDPIPRGQPALSADGSLLLTGGHWKLQNSLFVQSPGGQISAVGFDDSLWIPATVPGTVLGSYLAHGAVPDPWYGDQMSQISEDFFSNHDFWFRNEVIVPREYGGRRIWLNFNGINWKAEIFLDGAAIGRIDGAFMRGRFDVTELVRPGQVSSIAVLIHRVAHPEHGPGKVIHKRLGAPTTNGDLMGLDSPTFLASAGWNWLPIVRGRNIGIWNDVALETSGDVTIADPWLTTALQGISHADLTIDMKLRNQADTERRGKILGTIGDLTFEFAIVLGPREERQVILGREQVAALRIENPRLWWPNGYGEQSLYRVDLAFELAGSISDRKRWSFGIRSLECKVLHNVLTVFVNGTRILLRGGNWGMAEGMLQCDAAGLDLRLRLHRDANLNMVRNWIGMEGHEAFYDACDRYGILVWDDFWLANPANGPDPSDHTLFMTNVEDKIRRVRGHAALAFYCGRNEGFPPADLDTAMRASVNLLDGTRHYIPHSADGTVSGLGPYDVKEAEWYFVNRGRDLHSEQGIIAIPTEESMRAMMPEESLWPISDMWAVHDYQEPRSRLYTDKIGQRFGPPTGLADYCRKAQLLNLESAKAMFECLQANQGSGMLLWMTQSAWPSLICQLYDHYFEMTGAYFGAKSGCEPLHILWDAEDDAIKVANNLPSERIGLTAEAKAFDLNSRELWHRVTELDVPATTARVCFPFERPTDRSSVFFLSLRLSRSGEMLSENFYWGCAKGGSCVDLNHLPTVELHAAVEVTLDSHQYTLKVSITNPTQSMALAVQLKVQRATSSERVPVFYSDNFLSLLPGAKRTVTVQFASTHQQNDAFKLIAEGWNTPRQEILLT